jgi:tetratricopeptide (TPR) repeat protein
LYSIWLSKVGDIVDDHIFKQFKSAREIKDIREKVCALTKLIKKYPTENAIRYEYIRCLINSNDPELISIARLHFEKMIGTHNENYAMFELGKLDMQEGNLSMAAEHFEHLIAVAGDKSAMFELGKLEILRGNYKKAKACLAGTLLTKNNVYATLGLGKIAIIENDCQAAKEYFMRLIDTDTKYYAFFELGKIYVSEGNIEKARNYFLEALNSSINSKSYALLELVFLEIREKNIEDAFGYFSQLSECEPDAVYGTKKMTQLDFYFKYKMGRLSEAEIKNPGLYFNRQLLDYDRERAIKHIGKHFDSDLFLSFNRNVNPYDLYDEAREMIVSENYNKSVLVDIYDAQMPNMVANIDGEDTDYIEIVTLPHSDNILTIYPVSSKNIKFGNQMEKIKTMRSN